MPTPKEDVKDNESAHGVAADPKKRSHKATYATDKRTGGYLVRVAGPNAERFAGRVVPVNTKAGAEHLETLSRLVWTGSDKETGEKVALYKFESKPRDEEQELVF
jgi:hypothetical protein